jgi:hypothetical protein
MGEAPAAREPWEPGSQKAQGSAPGHTQGTEIRTRFEAIPTFSHTSFDTQFTVLISAPIQQLWWLEKTRCSNTGKSAAPQNACHGRGGQEFRTNREHKLFTPTPSLSGFSYTLPISSQRAASQRHRRPRWPPSLSQGCSKTCCAVKRFWSFYAKMRRRSSVNSAASSFPAGTRHSTLNVFLEKKIGVIETRNRQPPSAAGGVRGSLE